MRESSGNPRATNTWDSNAAAGTPSKGLLQVIDPTFRLHHVPGTSMDPYDPVANITAACNYAAKRYGSIDNVYGPY
ncbi:transglycosylase SLT domain-containing protein [Streptomyces sp. 1222.5]|uniref:transglycosylase SLT domain-containing protein n=1 Tax=Streptomyces sp. 1222.5 TaxID=1881026 RepID=UPI003EBA9372